MTQAVEDNAILKAIDLLTSIPEEEGRELEDIYYLARAIAKISIHNLELAEKWMYEDRH